MAERGDMDILHEPFSGLYYEVEAKAAAVGYQSNGTRLSYKEIKDSILKKGTGNQHVFVKDMAYHCLEHLTNDTDWLCDARHVFLVREPEDAIASHYAINPNVTSEEIGFESLCKLYELVESIAPENLLVVSSEDLKIRTERVMEKVCDYCQVPYLPNALNWRKPPPKEWKSWEAWHQDASQSRKINNRKKLYSDTVYNTPLLKQYLDEHMPYYNRLKNHAVAFPNADMV